MPPTRALSTSPVELGMWSLAQPTSSGETSSTKLDLSGSNPLTDKWGHDHQGHLYSPASTWLRHVGLNVPTALPPAMPWLNYSNCSNHLDWCDSNMGLCRVQDTET
ncbi:hypothetical protein AYL99_10063 [Fonsecaea erecta]|uniref:Uncharacterized protein n=1 Tax=Fonsecaea erecta TaxID=1367422 RepID=A0A178Z8U3_9EURO|nr:hypothetical protein AYL99_10063 [Fonsecaea erecta]OAP55911.1 hypothetical protein AYL99_10063 [Fonsecaea erecta]